MDCLTNNRKIQIQSTEHHIAPFPHSAHLSSFKLHQSLPCRLPSHPFQLQYPFAIGVGVAVKHHVAPLPHPLTQRSSLNCTNPRLPPHHCIHSNYNMAA